MTLTNKISGNISTGKCGKLSKESIRESGKISKYLDEDLIKKEVDRVWSELSRAINLYAERVVVENGTDSDTLASTGATPTTITPGTSTDHTHDHAILVNVLGGGSYHLPLANHTILVGITATQVSNWDAAFAFTTSHLSAFTHSDIALNTAARHSTQTRRCSIRTRRPRPTLPLPCP